MFINTSRNIKLQKIGPKSYEENNKEGVNEHKKICKIINMTHIREVLLSNPGRNSVFEPTSRFSSS